MTLGATAGVRLIVWYKACQHQVEPDAAEVGQSRTLVPSPYRRALWRSLSL